MGTSPESNAGQTTVRTFQELLAAFKVLVWVLDEHFRHFAGQVVDSMSQLKILGTCNLAVTPRGVFHDLKTTKTIISYLRVRHGKNR